MRLLMWIVAGSFDVWKTAVVSASLQPVVSHAKVGGLGVIVFRVDAVPAPAACNHPKLLELSFSALTLRTLRVTTPRPHAARSNPSCLTPRSAVTEAADHVLEVAVFCFDDASAVCNHPNVDEKTSFTTDDNGMDKVSRTDDDPSNEDDDNIDNEWWSSYDILPSEDFENNEHGANSENEDVDIEMSKIIMRNRGPEGSDGPDDSEDGAEMDIVEAQYQQQMLETHWKVMAMTFWSQGDAYIFYNKHAKEREFGIRREKVKRRKDASGIIRFRRSRRVPEGAADPSMAALGSKLAQLQAKACEATRFAARHGCAYHKTLMEKNKQFVVQPPTVEKCQELSKQLFYTRIASIPGRCEAFWKEVDQVKQLWRNRSDLNVEHAGIAALFGLELYGWFCVGEIAGRGFTLTGYSV
ncbi:hypothetical protein D1007_59648 [Hordeum vulgare]|nr:hypothetical protein D1007_59648 [Hordeum vulgare]